MKKRPPSSPRHVRKTFDEETEQAQRMMLAEQLEPRILYSASPGATPDAVEVEEAAPTPEVAHEAPAAEVEGPTESAAQGALSSDGGETISDESLMDPSVEDVDASEITVLLFEGEGGAELESAVDQLVEEAQTRWQSMGLSEAQEAALENVTYRIADLGGLELAYAEGNVITIDDDAAGQGWFVDTTPDLDEEFAFVGDATTSMISLEGSEAEDRFDLLSVIMHEQGHILGLEDLYGAEHEGELLHGAFETDVRRLATFGLAEDATPGSLAGKANASLTVTNTADDGTASGAAISLREAINQATDGNIITLDAGTFELSIAGTNENANAGGDLDINNKDITIIGAGKGMTIIDANQLDRVFHVLGGSNVTFQDLTITGGELNYNHGAGLLIEGSSNVIMTNVEITGNVIETPNTANVDRHGGGFRITGGTLTGTNVDITGNTAQRAGAGRNAFGGGFWATNGAVVTLNDSTISNNDAREGGGFYLSTIGTTVNLNGVILDSNDGLFSGGAIRTSVGTVVNVGASATRNSTFTNNTSSDGSAGAIRNEGGIITITGGFGGNDLVFDNNDAELVDGGYGGAIYNRLEGELNLTDVTITNSNSYRGGAIQQEQAGTVLNATRLTIDGNTAVDRGGGIYAATQGTIVNFTDSVISNNEATDFYGGGIYNHGTMTLVNTNIESNHTLDLNGANRRDGHGGGFFNGDGGILTLDENSDVLNNNAYGYGGGGMNQGGILNANGNTWSGNHTIYNNSDRNGGALWNYLGGVANINGATFIGNFTGSNGANLQGQGGAIYNSDQAVLNITGGSVFTENRANNGGAISQASNGTISNFIGTASENILIEGNYARSDGGGIRNNSDLSRMNLDYVTIRNNIAEGADGGGIVHHNGILRANHVTITNNAAGTGNDDDGGGIFVDNRSDIVFTNSVISDNVAYDRGGGVYIEGEVVQVKFENSIVSGNKTGIDQTTATGYIAGAANSTGYSLSTATNNTNGGSEGGAFYLRERAKLELVDSSIVDNIARDDGGAIRTNDDSQLTIVGTLIARNLAGFDAAGTARTVNSHGGAININGRTIFSMRNSAVLDNEASQYGGGIMLQGTSTENTILNSTFAGNVARDHGGGINAWGDTIEARIENTTLSGNYAGFSRAENAGVVTYVQNRNGGGLYVRRAIVEASHLTITDNVGQDGAGLRLQNEGIGYLTLTNSVVAGNRQNGGTANNASIGSAARFADVDSHTNDTGAAFNALSDGFAVGAENAGGDGTVSALGQVQVHLPTTGSTSIIDAVTNEIFASDQLGGGRPTEGDGSGGGVIASDRGAVELVPLATSLSLIELDVPMTAISGVPIVLDATANSTGGGDLQFAWTVTDSGGATVFSATNTSSVDLAADETDQVTFTQAITDDQVTSDELTVTLVVTDLTTGQTETRVDTLNLLNPDACPTTVTVFTVTTATDVVDAGDGLISFREAVTAANGSSAGDVTINFDAGLDTTAIISTIAGNDNTNTGGDFDFTKTNGSIIVVGNGAANTILDGGGIDRVINVRPGASVYLKDLTIQNGVTIDSDHGAGLRIDGANVFMTNVDIKGNQATRGAGNVGGGFYATGSGSLATNVVMNGGSISENTAGDHGGGFYLSGNINVVSSVVMTDVTIEGNQASGNDDGTSDGGGFYFTGYNNRLDFTNVTIADNAARDDGGGFVIVGVDHVANFNNVTIQRNVADNVLNDTDATTSYTNVAFNSAASNADRDGGGGYIAGSNNVINFVGGTIGGERNTDGTLLNGNYAEDDGAGLAIKGAVTVNFDGTAIEGNSSEDDGGGLLIEGNVTVSFDNGSISENHSIDQQGGGVALRSGVFNSTNSTFTENKAGDRVYDTDPADRVGGAFYVTGGSTANLVDATVEGNIAEGRGGAFFVERTSEVVVRSSVVGTKTSTISGNRTEENNTSRGGGAIYLTHATSLVTLIDVTVADNRSADEGGAIFLANAAEADLTRVDLLRNESQNAGGALFGQSDQSSFRLQDVNVLGNAARVSHGGGIYTTGTITGDSIVIKDNRTGYDLDTASVVASGSQDRRGGGIYIAGQEASLTASNVIIENNDSYGRGGGVGVDDGSLDLTNFIIRGNTTDSNDESRGRGGGIYSVNRGTVTLVNGEISDNTSRGDGGGLYQETDNSRGTLTNVTVSGNQAGVDPTDGALQNSRDGGAFLITSQSYLTLDHVTVANNTSTRNGGGLQRESSSVVVAKNSIFADNNRDVDNAAIRGDTNGNLTIEGVVVIEAFQGGTLTQTDGTRISNDPTLEALAENGGPATLNALAAETGIAGLRTHALPTASEAVNSAVGSTLTTDARDAVRTTDGADLGAFEKSAPEFDTVTVTIAPGSESGAGNVADGGTVNVVGEILYDLVGGETAETVVVVIDWGDGSQLSRIAIPAGTDFSTLSPDFNVDHKYAYGLDGQYELSVGITSLGQSLLNEEYTQTITVDDVATLTATTNEDDAVTVGPNAVGDGTGVVSSGQLLVDDATPIPDLNRLGWAVDIDGDLAILGGEGSGHREEVHIYHFDGTNWNLEQTLFNDTIDIFDDFGYAVNIDAANGRAFIGAQLDDQSGGDAGAAYYYDYDAGRAVGQQWVLQQKIRTGNGGDQFGSSIDASGDVLAIGASSEDGNSTTSNSGSNHSGAAYIYTYNSGTNQYELGQKLKAQSDASTLDVGGSDNFGWSIAVENGTVVVGSRLNDDTGSNSGSAYVYADDGSGNFVFQAKLAASDQGGDDRFGYDVDISGDRIVVGARQTDEGGSNRGSVYVYERTGVLWTEIQHINGTNSGHPNSSDSDAFGGSVAIDGDRILTASYRDDVLGTDSGQLHLFTFNSGAGTFDYAQSFFAEDASARDELGLSVAISGDRYFAGARLANATYTTDDGAVISMPQFGASYLFEGTPGSAVQVAKLDGDLANADIIGGRVTFGRDVAIGGDWAIIGAPEGGKANSGANDEPSGVAYLYHRNDFGTLDTSDDTWSLVETLRQPDTDDGYGDQFGSGVAISEDGSTVAIGAFNHESGGTDQGAAYIYTVDTANGDVTLEGRIRAANRTNDDEFGRRLSLSEDGSVLAVGMRSDDDGGSASGAVLVYTAAGGDWNTFFAGATTQNGLLSINSNGVKLKPTADDTGGSPTTASDEFGRSLAVSGNRIVVGAMDDDHPLDDNGNNTNRDRGSAYVFEFDGTNWNLQQKLFASNNGQDDRFGWGVDIDGDTVIVGANQEDTGGSNRGSAYVFEFDSSSSTWTETQRIQASNAGNNDHFGRDVAIDDGTIVVGAYLEDSSGSEAGAIYVFQKDAGGDYAEIAMIAAPDGSSRDNFGLAVAIDQGNIVVGAQQADRVLADGTVIANFGAAYTYRVLPASNASVTIDSVTQPTNGTVTTDGNDITFTPAAVHDALNVGETAIETFTYTTASGTATATITIEGRNDTPIGVDDGSIVAQENSSVGTGNVLTNDIDDDTGETLTVSRVDGSTANVGTAVTTANGGLATINSDGSVTYDANGQFEYLALGETAVDTITYHVTDSDGQVIYQEVDGAFIGNAVDFSSSPDTWEVKNAADNPNSISGSRTGDFLQVPNGVGGINAPSLSDPTVSPLVTYQIEVKTAGTYQLFLRGAGYDGGSDSLYVSIADHGDGVAGGNPDWYGVSIPLSADFTWRGNGNLENASPGSSVPIEFTLAAGLHTIQISAREDGAALDAFMLRNTATSTVAAPSGTAAGPPAQQEATVTFTITGESDAPVIAPVDVIGDIDKATTLTDTGSIDFTDLDLTDRPVGTEATASVTATADGGGALTLTAAQQQAIEDAFSIANPGANTNDGSVNWTYTIAAADLEFLGAGEAVTAVFTITVTDDDSLADTQNVTINITGANDAPEIQVVDATGAITEGATLTDAGSVTFTDVNSTDRPVATEATSTVTAQTVGGSALILTAAQQAAIEDAFTIGADAGNTNNGTVNWNYLITESELNFLAAGEVVTAVFTITVTDDEGADDTEDVTVTITGANDAPVISVATGDSIAEAATETDAGIVLGGSLTVEDLDATDTVAPSVVSVVPAGDMGSLDNASLLAMASVGTADTITNGATTGTINWVFDSGSEAFDHLDAGEVLTLTYTLRATDSPTGASDDQTVTVTITGSADSPVAVDDGSATSAYVTTDEDTNATIPDPIANNDFDPDGDTLSISTFDGLSVNGATITQNLDGSFTFDASQSTALQGLQVGESIIDSFTYTITDGAATPVAGASTDLNGRQGNLSAFGRTTNTTFETLIQPTDLLGNEIIFESGGGNGVGLVLAGDQLIFSVTQNSGGNQTARVSHTLTAADIADPLHIIGTFDFTGNGTSTLYVNGVQVGTQVSVANITTFAGGDGAGFAETGGVNLGGFGGGFDASLVSGNTGDPFAALEGDASLFRIYNDTLFTQTEVDQNFAAAVPNSDRVDTATVFIEVTGVNDAPVGVDDTDRISEEDGSTGAVLANDIDADIPDQGNLVVTAINGSAGDLGTEITLASGATVTLDASGNYSYDTNGAFDALSEGQQTSDSFTYEVTDLQGATGTATVTIEIVGTNDGPTANADTYTVNEDSAATSGNVITDDAGSGADSDPDTNDTLSIESFDATGTEGTVSIATPGVVGAVGQVTNLGQVGANTTTQIISWDPAVITDAVIIANPPTFNGSASTIVQVMSVDNTLGQAEVRILESPDQDQSHATEDFSYLVLQRGVHRLGDGTLIEVGTLDSLTTTANAVGGGFQNIPLTAGFTGTPVVVTQTQTLNETDGDIYFTTRQRLSGGNLQVTIEEAEGNGNPAATAPNSWVQSEGTHVVETIGFIAIAEGSGGWNGFTYEAFTTDPLADQNARTLDFDLDHGSAPNFVGTLASYFGADNAVPRIEDLTSTSVDIRSHEDISNDTELSHSAESVAYLAIGGSGELTAFAASDVQGAFTYDASGQFEYLADGESANDTFTYTITDGHGGTSTETVTVQILGANDGPVKVTGVGAQSSNEGAVLNLTDVITFTDLDLTDTPTITINWGDGNTDTGLSADLDTAGVNNLGGAAVSTANQFSLDASHTFADNGVYTVNVSVDDGKGGATSHSFDVTVNNVAPTAVNDAATTNEDTAVVITNATLVANDTDPANPAGSTGTPINDPLIVTAVGTPTNGGTATVDASGNVTYDPNAAFESLSPGQSDTDSFTYTISDGDGGTSTATVTVTITGVDDAPILVDDDYTATNPVDEDSVLNIAADGVLANDIDPDGPYPIPFIAGSTTSANGASVVLNEDGSFSYDPTNAAILQGLDDGESFVDTFTYSILGEGTATESDGPFAWDFGALGNLDTWALLNGEAFFRNSVNEGNGVTAGRDGEFGHDPAHDNFLISSPVLRFDGTTLDAAGHVLSVQFGGGDVDGNNSPETFPTTALYGGPDDVTGYNGGTSNSTGHKAVAFLNVLTGEYDAFVFDTSGNGGRGNFSYTAAELDTLGVNTATGAYQLQYFDTDSGGWGWQQFNSISIAASTPTAEQSATVSILVTGVNDDPVANDELYIVDEDAALTGQVLTNDTDIDDLDTTGADVDEDPQQVVAVNGVAASVDTQITLASGALLTVNADGSFDYDQNGAFEQLGSTERAVDSFTYTMSDNDGVSTQVGTSSATVTIEINGINDDPTAVDDGYTVSENGTLTVDPTTGVLSNDTDPDTSDALVVSSTDTSGTEGTVTIDDSTGVDGGLLVTLLDLNADLPGSANDIRLSNAAAWLLEAPLAGEVVPFDSLIRLGLPATDSNVAIPELNFPSSGANPFPANVGGNNDRFAAVFEGTIDITTAGDYTFGANSDDGTVIYIDGVRVVDRNQFGGFTTATTGVANLTTGQHDIKVYFFEGGGGAGIIATVNGADTGNADQFLQNLTGTFYDMDSGIAGGASPVMFDEIIAGSSILLETVVTRAQGSDTNLFTPYIDFGDDTVEETSDGVGNATTTSGNLFGGLLQGNGQNQNSIANDRTAALLTGYFLAPEAGTYTFGLDSDDGSVIYLNGTKVADANVGNATGTVTLTKGLNEILVGYYENIGGSRLQATVSGPGITGTQILGPENLSTTDAAGGDGSFAYDPNGQFEHLGAGESALDTFDYTITDRDGETSNATATITITGENDAITGTTGVGNQTINEGSVLSLTDIVSFSDIDENDAHTITVDWGDSTVSEMLTRVTDTAVVSNLGDPAAAPTTGNYSADGAHTYVEDGIYSVVVTVDDGNGSTTMHTFDVTVDNVRPVTTLDAIAAIDENGTVTLTGSITDPGLLDPQTVVIDWDDANNTVNSTFVVPSVHTAGAAGTTTATLTAGTQVNSSTDGSRLTVETVDPLTGAITFSVTHQYLDDGISGSTFNGANGTVSDIATIAVTVTDDDATVPVNAYKDQLIAEGANLTGYWQFDEESGAATAADSSSNGNDATLFGDVTFGHDAAFTSLGSSTSYDGSADYFSTGATTGELGLTGDFTVSAWINLADTSADRTIIGTDTSGANNGLHLVIRAGKPHFGFFGNDTGGVQTVNTDEWYHVTWRFDSSTGEQAMFVNGGLDRATTGHAAFGDGVPGAENHDVKIGRSGGGRHYEGLMDEVSIVNRVMTDGEIAALFALAPVTSTVTTTVTINNVAPVVAVDAVAAITENGTATLTGTLTDPGTLDSHQVTVDWGDPNNTSDSIFNIDAIRSTHPVTGGVTDELAMNDTFDSTSDDAVLTITSVDAATGVVGFSVTHQYLDDGASDTNFANAANGTPSDTFTINVTVSDDDQLSYAAAVAGDPDLTAFWRFEENADATTANDSSSTGADGELQGDMNFTSSGATATTGGAGTFDGNGDYINTGQTFADLGLGGDFTVSAWVNIDPAGTSSDNTILGTDTNGMNNGLHLVVRNMKPHFGFFSSDTGGIQTLNADQWYLLTWRFDASNGEQAIFVDGVLDNSATGKGPFTGLTNEIKIGRWRGDDGLGMHGSLDEVSIIDRAMTDDEIAGLFAISASAPASTGTTVTVNNAAPALSISTDSPVDENTAATVTGTLTDIGRLDSHQVTIVWDDVNDVADATFDLSALFDVNDANGELTQVLGTVGQTVFNSSSDDSVLTITSVDTDTGVINFTVSHIFQDDGLAGGNGTTNDTSTVSVTVTDDDGQNANETSDVVVNNVAPDITIGAGDSAAETIAETDAGLTTVGTLSVADSGILDVVTATVESVASVGDTDGIANATLQNYLTLGANPVIGGTATMGTISWSFDSGSEAFDHLAVGETLVLNYTVRASDDDLGTDDQIVTITITGTNDAPVITDGPDTAVLDETDAALTAGGSLTVSDADTTDLVSVAHTISITGSSDRSDTAAPSDADLLAMLTLTPTAVLDGTERTDTVAWAFDSGTEAFDYLATGETLILTYTVTATDSQSATDTETVTITINGTNDDPVISVEAGDSSGETLTEVDSPLTTTGTLSVGDVDTTDVVTAQIDSINITGNSGTLTPAELLAMLELGANPIIDGTMNDGEIVWSFDSGTEAFDYLGEGDSLVLEYTVEVEDDNGATDTQTVTITVEGSNDIPQITNVPTVPLVYTEGDGEAIVSHFVSLSDKDDTILTGATIQITSGYVRGEDLLSLDPLGGIAVHWNSATGTLTLTGDSPISIYEAALRLVTYENLSAAPSDRPRQITFTVFDDEGASDPVSRALQVVPVADLVIPIITDPEVFTTLPEDGEDGEPAGEEPAFGDGRFTEGDLQGILSSFRDLDEQRIFGGFRFDDLASNGIAGASEEGSSGPLDGLGGEGVVPILSMTPFFAGTGTSGDMVNLQIVDSFGIVVAESTSIVGLTGNWVAAFPGVSMVDDVFTVRMTVLSSNLLGDAEQQELSITFDGARMAQPASLSGLSVGEVFGAVFDPSSVESALSELVH